MCSIPSALPTLPLKYVSCIVCFLLSSNRPLKLQLLINGILAIWNFFWAVLAAFMCDKLGRRFLFMVSASGMLIFFTCQTICIQQFLKTKNQTAAHSMIAFIFLFYASYE